MIVSRAFFVVAKTLMAGAAAPAWAWPDKPVRIVVTFAASAASGIVAHTLSELLAKARGQPVILDNKPGPAARRARLATSSLSWPRAR